MEEETKNEHRNKQEDTRTSNKLPYFGHISDDESRSETNKKKKKENRSAQK